MQFNQSKASDFLLKKSLKLKDIKSRRESKDILTERSKGNTS